MKESTGFKAQVSSIVTEVLQSLGIISKDKPLQESTEGKGQETTTEAAGAITAELRADIEAAVSVQIKPLHEQLTKAQNDLKAANEASAGKDKEISDLKAKAQTVEEAAAEKARKTVTAQAVPVAGLPTGVPAGATTDQQIEALQKQLAAEQDPEKSYTLAAKINKLRFGSDEKK